MSKKECDHDIGHLHITHDELGSHLWWTCRKCHTTRMERQESLEPWKFWETVWIVRANAAEHQDYDQVAICDRILTGKE